MKNELILRMCFRKHSLDEPQYLSVDDLEEAIESVEIFGNRWGVYDLEMQTDDGWVPYIDSSGDGLKGLMKKNESLVYRMTVDTATNSMIADKFYFRRSENRKTYDMIRLDCVKERIGNFCFNRFFGDVGYRNDVDE